VLQWLLLLAFSIPVSSDPHPPVVGQVVESFRAPACLRCAGRRGVVIRSRENSPVWAVTPGVVSFVGQVAHQVYVVVETTPGVKVTYGWLADTAVAQGEAVSAGQVLATTRQRTYLGVRVNGHYVEPLRFLGLSRPGLVGPGWISPMGPLSRGVPGPAPLGARGFSR
jgi:murein DD-endopeptidase MepM/ murein hydrolase activator NlpD